MRTAGVRPRFVVVALLAMAAVVAGVLMPHLGSSDQSSADRIAADPPPALFAAKAVAPLGREVDDQRPRATRLLQEWVAANGTRPRDAAFVRWIEDSFPPPPGDLADQLREVQALGSTRTAAGVRAATWLEAHGKKDVWKVFAHDQREWLGHDDEKALKQEEKDLLAMSKDVADALGAQFQSSAPYVRDPSLRSDHHVAPGATCPCSYPSRHATAAAASETLLGGLQPRLDAEYRYLEDQIDFSRVYMAGHFPADIAAGATLGDLIGDYFLVTRQGADPASLT